MIFPIKTTCLIATFMTTTGLLLHSSVDVPINQQVMICKDLVFSLTGDVTFPELDSVTLINCTFKTSLEKEVVLDFSAVKRLHLENIELHPLIKSFARKNRNFFAEKIAVYSDAEWTVLDTSMGSPYGGGEGSQEITLVSAPIGGGISMLLNNPATFERCKESYRGSMTPPPHR